MRVTVDQLQARAHELERLADGRGVAWQDQARALPERDPVARIGLLAHLLGIDLPAAFDPNADIQALAQTK